MGIHDGFGNGQAQAKTVAVGTGVVGAVKAVKNAGELVRRDIRPLIGHGHHSAAALPDGGQADGRTGCGVFDGVIQQHRQGLAQLGAVAPDRKRRRNIVIQHMAGLKGHRLKPQGGSHRRLRQVGDGVRRAAGVLLGAEEGEHILHQGLHAAALRPDIVHVDRLLRRSALLQQLGGGKDDRQRGLQLMAGVGEELLLLGPGGTYRLGNHTGEQIAAQKQHHQCAAAHQRAGLQQCVQGGVFQIGIGKRNGSSGVAPLAQIAQMKFVQRAGVLVRRQGGSDDLRHAGLVAEVIVAVAGHADGAAAIDLGHKAGYAVHAGLAAAIVALLQRLVQLLLHILVIVAPGDEVHRREHRQQHQRDQQHIGGHHLPAKVPDHASTSRQ